jgi:hypothetical protein
LPERRRDSLAADVVSQPVAGEEIVSPHTRKLISAVIFAVLWIGSMLWWSGSFDQQTVLITVIMGVIAGLLWYLLFDWFNKLFNR